MFNCIHITVTVCPNKTHSDAWTTLVFTCYACRNVLYYVKHGTLMLINILNIYLI